MVSWRPSTWIFDVFHSASLLSFDPQFRVEFHFEFQVLRLLVAWRAKLEARANDGLTALETQDPMDPFMVRVRRAYPSVLP